jgi:hypothetical protein
MPRKKKSDPPVPAKPNVLLLPEVVFELITHLDCLSLLRCQRVCRTWASAISRSRDAQQRMFKVADDRPFQDFKAAEEHDIATEAPAAWKKPSDRIPRRPEFRQLFNPWVFKQGRNPFEMYRRFECRHLGRPAWRFTNRVCSGRLDFVYLDPHKLVALVNVSQASWLKMFLTQPPIKRVIVSVGNGYGPSETFDIEKPEGVRIGDVMAKLKRSHAVNFLGAMDQGERSRIVSLKIDEHFEGVRFMPLQQLVKDKSGNVDAKTIL